MSKYITEDVIANEMFRLLKQAQQHSAPEKLSPLDPGQTVRVTSHIMGGGEDTYPVWVGISPTVIGYGIEEAGTGKVTMQKELTLFKETAAKLEWNETVDKISQKLVESMNLKNSVADNSAVSSIGKRADDDSANLSKVHNKVTHDAGNKRSVNETGGPEPVIEDEADDEADDELGKFLMNEEDDDADDVSYVDDEITDMQDRAGDDAEDEMMRSSNGSHEVGLNADDPGTHLMASAEDRHMMEGLGKIEASLRRKGEGFAADLVRTTALSISEDIVKEAAQKTYVLKNLVKMAADLEARGEKKAATMLRMTVGKINR